MKMLPEDESERIRDECRRLEAAVRGNVSDRGSTTLGQAIEASKLAQWVKDWGAITPGTTCMPGGEGSWVAAFRRVCIRLVEVPAVGVNGGSSSSDHELARLFVNEVVSEAYGVYVCTVAARNLQEERGWREELVECLQAIGASAARYIADPRAPPSKGMNKLANTTWTMVYNALKGQQASSRDRCAGVRAMSCLVEIIERCFACMDQEGCGKDMHKVCSKALKFLISNYGRLLMLVGEDSQPADVWSSVQETVVTLWNCLVRHISVAPENDPFDGVGLTYKAVALSFEYIRGDQVPWQTLDGRISPGVLQVFANVMIRGCEKMSGNALTALGTAIPSLVGYLASETVQLGMNDSIMSDLEVGILEFMSRCVDANARVFMHALYHLMGFLVRPHPLVEELLCRVMMGLMEWGWESLQVECMEMMCDILERTISCDEDLGLTPGIEQGVNVLAATMVASGESVAVRVGEARFASPTSMSSSPSSSAGSLDTVDVCDIARLSIYLRAVACCGSSFVPAGGMRHAPWLRGQLDRIAKIWTKRPKGSDSELLLAWCAECLFHTSKIVSSGPLSERQITNGATSIVDSLVAAIDRVRGCLILSASPDSAHLQRAAVLLDGASTLNVLKKNSIDGLEATLDAFDATSPMAGWLVGLAPTRTQRPTIRMRRVYGNSLDTGASVPLQYLAMQSYKEYVSFSDSDEAYGVGAGGDQALDVIPKCHIVGGSMSTEFKARLTPYLVGIAYGECEGTMEERLRQRLAIASMSLEKGFNRISVSTRTHRQVVATSELGVAVSALRKAHQSLDLAMKALKSDGIEQKDKSEIRALASQMQLSLNSFLRTS